MRNPKPGRKLGKAMQSIHRSLMSTLRILDDCPDTYLDDQTLRRANIEF